jgi:zinc transport system permease protein
MDDFLLRALLAGVGVALVAGPLGCFVVWRRMAYFGATLSHGALLGVAIGLLLRWNLQVGVFAICVVISLALLALQRQAALATDTLLGILAHATLAVGLVLLSFFETVRVDLMGYLFGDILAVSATDLAWIYAGAAVCLGLLAGFWRPFLMLTVHQDLARVEGVPVEALRTAFLLLMSLVVAAAMQVVGLLLIVSLLILPAAVARRYAVTPESMALLAVGAGIAGVAGGLGASLTWDTPAGPSIVTVLSILFAVAWIVPLPARR